MVLVEYKEEINTEVPFIYTMAHLKAYDGDLEETSIEQLKKK